MKRRKSGGKRHKKRKEHYADRAAKRLSSYARKLTLGCTISETEAEHVTGFIWKYLNGGDNEPFDRAEDRVAEEVHTADCLDRVIGRVSDRMYLELDGREVEAGLFAFPVFFREDAEVLSLSVINIDPKNEGNVQTALRESGIASRNDMIVVFPAAMSIYEADIPWTDRFDLLRRLLSKGEEGLDYPGFEYYFELPDALDTNVRFVVGCIIKEPEITGELFGMCLNTARAWSEIMRDMLQSKGLPVVAVGVPDYLHEAVLDGMHAIEVLPGSEPVESVVEPESPLFPGEIPGGTVH